MNYQIIDIGRDYPGEITDFSAARNGFLEKLRNDEYILWKSKDEEHSRMLLDYLEILEPKFPYYAIRRINLWNGRYRESFNPDYSPHLVSNRIRYLGAVHEKVLPRHPYGKIDYPIIHNHIGGVSYGQKPRRILPLAIRKAIAVMTE